MPFILIFMLLISPTVFANTLDAATIQKIHVSVHAKFDEGCKKQVQDDTKVICDCLSRTAEEKIDDIALSQCSADEAGMPCITKIVSDAATQAMSKESVQACIEQSDRNNSYQSSAQIN